jgi:serine/threonine protein kinase
MIALSGIAIQSKIYGSLASVVYRGIREEDGRAVIIKLLKQDYPSAQELIRYKQEYEITRSLQLEGVVKAYSQQIPRPVSDLILKLMAKNAEERY